MQQTLGPSVLQIWPRYPYHLGAPKPSWSTVCCATHGGPRLALSQTQRYLSQFVRKAPVTASRALSGVGCCVMSIVDTGRYTTEGPSWGYPVPGLGAVFRCWNHFDANCCQKLTNLVKDDFEIPLRRDLRGLTTPLCAGACEDRTKPGPPRAITQVIYVDLAVFRVHRSDRPTRVTRFASGKSWTPCSSLPPSRPQSWPSSHLHSQSRDPQ